MNSYQCLGKGYIKVRQRHSNFSTLSYLKESDSKPLASTHTPTKKSFFLLMDQFSLWFVVLTLFLRKERFFIWKTVIQKTSYVSVRSLFYFIKVIVKRIQSNIFRLRLKKKKSNSKLLRIRITVHNAHYRLQPHQERLRLRGSASYSSVRGVGFWEID